MDLSLILTLAVIHLAGLISPGPDLALVLNNSHSLSRKAALLSAFGIALGVLAHAVLAITGISILIANYPMLHSALQLISIGYLLWLGQGAIRGFLQSRTQNQQIQGTASNDLWSAFAKGFLTNLLNPKAVIYFVSLIAALIPTDITPLTQSILITELFLLTFVWFGGLAWFL